MGARNNNISLILANAKRQGFFPDVADTELGVLEAEASLLFGDDTIFAAFPAVAIRAGVQDTAAFSRKQTGASGFPLIFLEDDVANDNHLISLRHYASKSGDANSQTYALDISNRPGANRAFVIHQYSNFAEAMRIDNTDNKPALRIVNTENQTLNPGGVGSGDAIVFDDWGTVRFRVTGTGGVIIQAKDTEHSLWISGPTTGTKSPLYVNHNNPANGVQIIAGVSSAGFYPLFVGGQNYGPAFTTSTDGGQTLNVTKNGTGAGDALRVTNKGTGATVQINQNATPVARINSDGELEQLIAGKGDLRRSPNGTRYRITVTDAGAVLVTAAP